MHTHSICTGISKTAKQHGGDDNNTNGGETPSRSKRSLNRKGRRRKGGHKGSDDIDRAQKVKLVPSRRCLVKKTSSDEDGDRANQSWGLYRQRGGRWRSDGPHIPHQHHSGGGGGGGTPAKMAAKAQDRDSGRDSKEDSPEMAMGRLAQSPKVVPTGKCRRLRRRLRLKVVAGTADTALQDWLLWEVQAFLPQHLHPGTAVLADPRGLVLPSLIQCRAAATRPTGHVV